MEDAGCAPYKDREFVVCWVHDNDQAPFWDEDRDYCPVVADAVRAGWEALAAEVEPILSLLHHRGLVDSESNRADVEHALFLVRGALQ